MRWGLAFAFGLSACAAIVGLDDPAAVVDGPDATPIAADATTASETSTPRPDASPPVDAAVDAGPCGDPDLLAYWRFDEGQGTNVSDCTKYGHSGTVTGDPTWAPGPDGGFALSYTFEDSVDFGNPATLRLSGALSVTAWINVRTVTNAGRVITKSGGPGDRGWELNFEADARLRFRIALDADNQVEAALASFSTLSVWKHVAGVYEPDTAVRLYIDGVEAAATTTGVPAMQRDSTQDLHVGRRADCCSFDGAIDEVRVYKRALTAAEVQAIAAL